MAFYGKSPVFIRQKTLPLTKLVPQLDFELQIRRAYGALKIFAK